MPEAARHCSSNQPYTRRPARGYRWPPFEKGNLKAVRHGVHSERIISAKAAEVHERLLTQCPWVAELDLVTVELYCRAAARHYLLHDYFMGVADGTIEAAPSKDRPRTGVEAMPAYLLAELSAAASRAGKYGHQLGLDLVGWGKLVKRLGWERSVEIGLVPASLAEKHRASKALRLAPHDDHLRTGQHYPVALLSMRRRVKVLVDIDTSIL